MTGSRYRYGRGTASGGWIVAVLALALAAAVFFGGSALRGWLGEHITVPWLAPSPTPQQEAAQATPAPTGEPVTGEVVLPGITATAVQMGVFSGQEAAGEFAESIRSRGAAGYVYAEGDRFRVLAAAYLRPEDARAVQQSLSAAGVETWLQTLEAPAVTLEVTAGEEELAALKAGMEGFAAWLAGIEQVYLQQDTDPEAAARQLEALANEALRARDALSALPCGEEAVVSGMVALYDSYAQAARLPAGAQASAPAYFSGVRRLWLTMFEDYRAFTLSAQGGAGE